MILHTFRSTPCCKDALMNSESTRFSSPLTNLVFCISTKGSRVNTSSNLGKWYCYLAKLTVRILMTPNLFSNNSIYYHFDKITRLEGMQLLGLSGNRFNGLASSTFCPRQSILQIWSEGIFDTGETTAFVPTACGRLPISLRAWPTSGNNHGRNREWMTRERNSVQEMQRIKLHLLFPQLSSQFLNFIYIRLTQMLRC